jgi:hypothetical protein
MPRGGPRFSESEAREAIAASRSWTESLRRLDYCPTGGNPATLKKYAALWGISTDHFDPYAGVMERIRKPKRPLEDLGRGFHFLSQQPEDAVVRRGIEETSM